MRFATDTGGTFTDLIVEDDDGRVHMHKASTTPTDPVKGVLDALEKAATSDGLSLKEMLNRGDTFIHGTTHALNAIITGNVARTAFLTTEGHLDILTLREGGRTDLFDNSQSFPKPYIPRNLTFGISERIDAQGNVVKELDEQAVLETIEQLKALEIEAVAVCLLWSVVNPVHERRIGDLLAEHLPGVPFTLSFELNPIVREYRRASSTCIDASLKPLMTKYLASLTGRLRDNGFNGRVLMLTSGGGMLDAQDVAEQPIHSINSGPSMAPIAGRFFGQAESKEKNVIVADTGGTTYDVSLVRDDRIPVSRELWIGDPYRGHMTGFPSIDVKSVGAGGGSIAWVDDGGMLHVGPQSAGSEPGPVCYGRGGEQPTVTDASVVLGHLDAENFLGGAMKLDAAASRNAILEQIAKPLGVSAEEAAASILEIATENMVGAIADITIKQGVDPEQAVLIGGGGAAGLNSTWIARRLGCKRLVVPEMGPALSAGGALMSDLSAEYSATHFTTSDNFDFEGIEKLVAGFNQSCRKFIEGPGSASVSSEIEITVQARYKHQVWDIELPVEEGLLKDAAGIEKLVANFHDLHEQIFAIRDEGTPVEFINWSATVRCSLRETAGIRLDMGDNPSILGERSAYYPGEGEAMTKVYDFGGIAEGECRAGPAIIESPFTTVVVPPGASFERGKLGNLNVYPKG